MQQLPFFGPSVGTAPAPRRVGFTWARLLLCLGLIGLLSSARPQAASAFQAAGPAGQSPTIASGAGPVVVKIGTALSPGTLSLVRRAVALASDGSRTLILVLDTPGGEINLMWKIARALDRARDSKLRIIAFVDRQALSAGALLALSCDSIYMAPGSTMGASMPILGGGGIGLPTTVGEKYLSAFRAEFRSWAEKHSRNGALAEAMVDPAVEVVIVEENGIESFVSGEEWDDLAASGRPVSRKGTLCAAGTLLTLTKDEAIRYGMADGEAQNVGDLITSKLFLSEAAAVYVEETAAERAAAVLSQLAPVLIVLGVLFLYMELQIPGFGVFGFLGILCFALLLGGRYLTGLAGIEHFALIGLGSGLILLELFLFPGTLVAGITGAICVVVGLVWSQLGPDFPLTYALDRKLLFDSFKQTVIWSLVGLIASGVATRLLPRTPIGRRLVLSTGAPGGVHGGAVEATSPGSSSDELVGELGVALTPLRPVGKIELLSKPGVEWEGSAVGPALEAQTRVRVIGRSTGRLVVEEVLERPRG